MDSINILNIITASHGGGAEKLLLSQAKFSSKGVNLFIATLRESNLENAFRDAESKKNVHYISLNHEKRKIIKTFLELRSIIIKENIDVIHTHLIEPDFYGFFLKLFFRKVRWISSKHDVEPFRKGKIGIIDGLMARFTDQVIVVSKFAKNFFNQFEKIPKEKIKVIHNGVEINKFLHTSSRGLIGLKKQDFVLGIVGRLSKEKGHKELIETAILLREEIPSLKLVIVGTGPLEEELRRFAFKKDFILFLGFKENVEKIYPYFDILILPSKMESFGLVLVEALASGTPVIGTNIGGIPEIIKESKNGFLVSPKDQQQLSQIIRKCYFNPQILKELKKNSVKSISHFDIRCYVKKIEEVYKGN